MKYFSILFLAFLSFAKSAEAQSFTVNSDTVYGSIGTSGLIYNNITNRTGSDLSITWQLANTDFPSDWLTPFAFGVCDNFICVGNTGGTLWNTTTNSGSPQNSTYYANATHDSVGAFDLSLNLTGATSTGSHWVAINITDNGSSYTKKVTFIVTRNTTGITTINNAEDKTLLYPNPANNELNIVYDAAADVKNIAVYNIIGKVMSVYKVNGNSANLNIENVPSGIYFVKLYSSKGNVVVTRKFTKQ